jgi:hypothetical protein
MAERTDDERAAELRDEIVPFLGERAVTMFAFSVADGFPCPEIADPFRHEIEESGDDPLDPQVTEAERLLIDWGRLRGAHRDDVALDARVAATFQPKLRELLDAYADELVAECRRVGRR